MNIIKKNLVLVAVFLLGMITSVVIHYLMDSNLDLLLKKIDQPVIAQKEIKLINSSGDLLVIPVGTTLKLKSQYQSEGILSIEISSSSLDNFANTDRKPEYFETTLENDK